LCEGGAALEVTNANKLEFLDLLIEYKLSQEMEPQLQRLTKGFNDVISLHELQLFDSTELERVLCGENNVTQEDFFAHVEYKQGYSEDHKTIQLLRRVFDGLSAEQKRRLLQVCISIYIYVCV
jgi:hypothetical protein